VEILEYSTGTYTAGTVLSVLSRMIRIINPDHPELIVHNTVLNKIVQSHLNP
jgi:hypothetical protein